jgi:hypothetical protein
VGPDAQGLGAVTLAGVDCCCREPRITSATSAGPLAVKAKCTEPLTEHLELLVSVGPSILSALATQGLSSAHTRKATSHLLLISE